MLIISKIANKTYTVLMFGLWFEQLFEFAGLHNQI